MTYDENFNAWKQIFDQIMAPVLPTVSNLPDEAFDNFDQDEPVSDDSDIVDRLLYTASLADGFITREAGEAADEIARLRAQLENHELRLEQERRLGDALAAQLIKVSFTSDDDSAALIERYWEARGDR